MLLSDELSRTVHVRTGRHLELLTILWNSLEAIIAVAAGIVAGSIALVGFGLDSVIEVSSGVALLWRLSVDADVTRREQLDVTALKIVGASFLALAVYVAGVARSRCPSSFPDTISQNRKRQSGFTGRQIVCIYLPAAPPTTWL